MTETAKPEHYIGERVFLFPYSPAQPPHNRADSPLQNLLGHLYDRIAKDGVLDVLFAGDFSPSKETFIHRLYEKPIVVAFLKPQNEEIPEAIGLGWLHSFETCEGGPSKASFAFAFVRQYWGSKEIREAGKLALRWWFTELRVDVLFGSMRKRNILAQRFAREMSFKHVAEIPMFFCIPGGFESCVLVSMSREEYEQCYGEATAQEIAAVAGG